MKIKWLEKFIYIFILLLAASAVVLKFSGHKLLQAYVKSGIGDCKNIPILCHAPDKKIISIDAVKRCPPKSAKQAISKTKICVPSGFTVVEEHIKRVYYKKRKWPEQQAMIYLLCQEPYFFPNLFPRLKEKGITSNFEFLKHTMAANADEIRDITSAFFVIMKSIFIPDLGDLARVKMIEFNSPDRRGFINYNISSSGSYFDCNVTDGSDVLFKIYIRDKYSKLDLDTVMNLVSTVEKSQ